VTAAEHTQIYPKWEYAQIAWSIVNLHPEMMNREVEKVALKQLLVAVVVVLLLIFIILI